MGEVALLVPGDGVERIRRMDEVHAGQYWRLKDDAEDPRGRYNSEGVLPAGQVHLVLSLRYSDDDLHTIVVAPHPREIGAAAARGIKPADLWFLVDDFFGKFERAHDADAVRAKEIAAAQDHITRLQTELVEGPSDAPLIAPPDAAPPDLASLVDRAEQLPALRDRANELVEVNKKRAQWLERKAGEMSVAVQALTPYYGERAKAALASVENTLRFAADLNSGLKTLGLYTGEDVQVNVLAEGEPASPSEPLCFWQNLLYFDEEYLAHVALGGDGSDYQDLKDFGKALTEDRALLDRILPSPRSVVLMQFRRDGKFYSFNAFENAYRNQRNCERFLLVRCGGNVYQVWSELTTQSITQLFPSKSEHDSLFQGYGGSEIRPSDLDWTRAKDRNENYALTYKRVLVMLWGLNDRLSLFGEFYDKSRWTSFLDLEFQVERFRFISEDAGLPEIRPGFNAWVEEQNRMLQSGSRVLVRPKSLLNRQAVPAYDRLVQDPNIRLADPVWIESDYSEAAGVSIAHLHENNLVVDATVDHGWGVRSEFRTTLPLGWRPRRYSDEYYEKYRDSSLPYLCLDAVKLADVEWYLNSRANRRHYASYVALFGHVLEYLRYDESRTASFVEALEVAVRDASVSVPPGIDVGEQCRHALRMWRAAHRGVYPPVSSEKKYSAALSEAMNLLWPLIGMGKQVPVLAENLAAKLGREPYRLVMTGSGKYALYASLIGEERDETLGTPSWVARFVLESHRGELRVRGNSVPRIGDLPKKVASEEVLQEWPGCEAARARVLSPCSFSTLQAAKDAIDAAELFRFTEFDAAFYDRVREVYAEVNKGQKHIKQVYFQAPLALVRAPEDFRTRYVETAPLYTRETKGYVARDAILYARVNAFKLLYQTARDEAEREKIARAFSSTYARPEKARARLGSPSSIKLILVDYANLGKTRSVEGSQSSLKINRYALTECGSVREAIDLLWSWRNRNGWASFAERKSVPRQKGAPDAEWSTRYARPDLWRGLDAWLGSRPVEKTPDGIYGVSLHEEFGIS